jgi:hypothetical protein
MVWGQCSNSTVRYCTLTDVWDMGISVQATAAMTVTGVKLYGNIINRPGKSSFEFWPHHADCDYSNFIVAHNTVYGVGTGDFNQGYFAYERAVHFYYSVGSYGLQTNCLFCNNIIHSPNYWSMYTEHKDIFAEGGWVSDYNCFWPAETVSLGANCFRIDADNRSFAEWKSRSGEDAHSMVSDPLFTDAANGVFTLTADSPCKDAGMDAGLGLSYSGLGYDIGYDEYTAGAKRCPFRKAV